MSAQKFSKNYARYKAKVEAALSRRMPAGLDYLLATLGTDVGGRGLQQSRIVRCPGSQH